MNRETKRLMKRQGQMEADGSPASRKPPPTSRAPRQRTSIIQFTREIQEELRQVAWPNRSEMLNYSTVVFFTLVFMTTLIFFLNYGLGHAIVYMFET